MKLDELIAKLVALRAQHGGEIPTYFCFDNGMFSEIEVVDIMAVATTVQGDKMPPHIMLTSEFHDPRYYTGSDEQQTTFEVLEPIRAEFQKRLNAKTAQDNWRVAIEVDGVSYQLTCSWNLPEFWRATSWMEIAKNIEWNTLLDMQIEAMVTVWKNHTAEHEQAS